MLMKDSPLASCNKQQILILCSAKQSISNKMKAILLGLVIVAVIIGIVFCFWEKINRSTAQTDFRTETRLPNFAY